MKNQRPVYHLCMALALALLLAPVTWAQDSDPWEINADIDNDGVVGPTDIQHVINDALGLNDRGADAVDLPLRQYVVASPRASLSLLPGGAANGTEGCDTVGAASNFPRRNGRLLVRNNTGIVFRYDRNVEGVWHDDACGLLRSELIVHIQRLPEPTEGEDNTTDVAEKMVDEESAWRLLGRDGAAGRGCGPAVGTANIGVRHLFDVPGDYIVRSTIRTFAIPEREIVEAGEAASFCGATRDVDFVLTHVRVVPRRATDADLNWQTDDDANTVGTRFGTRLEKEPESTVELP